MKKSIYLSALAALTLTACSSDGDGVFDQSAAERLEQYKKEYADVLTDEGGLWTMEYFSNPDEPGYVFVMKFDKNGSVEISANHKWIGSEFKQETSLWKMIADNGPVLSFNSYNNLFHIFSDPADITGSNAPTGENGEINETGYGHEGDYEFQVMEVADDGQTVRLLGKKRMYDIFLHRLDPSTDVRKYLDDYMELSSTLFSDKIPNLIYKDAQGVRYVVNGAYSGIMSIYPENGDPVDQTRSGNFIITPSGIRFMNPLEIVDASGNPKTISEFKLVGNKALASTDDDSTISAGNIEEIFYNNKKAWKVDLKSVTGSVKNAIDVFVAQLRTLYGYRSANITDISFVYDAKNGRYVLALSLKIGQNTNETDRFFVDFEEVDGKLKINIKEAVDNNSQLAYNAYTTLSDLFGVFNSSPVEFSTPSDCGPRKLTLKIGGGDVVLNVQ